MSFCKMANGAHCRNVSGECIEVKRAKIFSTQYRDEDLDSFLNSPLGPDLYQVVWFRQDMNITGIEPTDVVGSAYAYTDRYVFMVPNHRMKECPDGWEYRIRPKVLTNRTMDTVKIQKIPYWEAFLVRTKRM